MKRTFYFLIFFLFLDSKIYADLHPFNEKNQKSLLLGYTRNYPVYKSSEQYKSSIYHPLIGFRHSSESWILGISTQFKILKDKKTDEDLILWTVAEEFNYKIRLYHPLYILIGGKFLYLMPVKKAVYPFIKNEEHTIEIGFGATSSLLYFFKNNTALGIYTDLWRGTGSQKFEALEVGFHMMLPLPF